MSDQWLVTALYVEYQQFMFKYLYIALNILFYHQTDFIDVLQVVSLK